MDGAGPAVTESAPVLIQMPVPDVLLPSFTLPDSAKIVIDDEAIARSRLDWDFVSSEIDAAVEHGLGLGDEVIRSIAERRFVYANKNYHYPSLPGSGATMESSEGIVRSIVDLYLLATASDAGGGQQSSPRMSDR